MQKPSHDIIDHALKACRPVLYFVLLFSFAMNILMIAMPIYSMQILDRVISSQSIDTLTMLTIVVLGLFLVIGLLNAARAFVLGRVGDWLDNNLAPQLFSYSVSQSAVIPTLSGSQTLRDLASLKGFVMGPALMALLDAPWTPFYVVILYLMHPWNGWMAIGGGAILLLLAILNDYCTKPPTNQANEISIKTMAQLDLATRNAEVIEAMGMKQAVTEKWQQMNDQVIALQNLSNNRSQVIQSITKIFRLSLQVLVLAMGTWLALHNELSPGSIIAASILMSRALIPFENAISSWKNYVSAKASLIRLKENLKHKIGTRGAMKLPAPLGNLSVENAIFTPYGASLPVIKGVSFALDAGEALAIVGPSASGKTTLSKLLVGIWQAKIGHVRLDGADVYLWEREDFGQHIGYLPQGVELFDGTVKENIARMQKDADPEKIVEAAQLAGVHHLILRLPNGYETEIGVRGSTLSAGQRQRIGLARAFYGSPKFIVLDEPNANLDQEGEAALAQALEYAKQKKITTITISHRPSILTRVDKILVLQSGMVALFGPRQEMLEKLFPTNPVAVNPTVSEG